MPDYAIAWGRSVLGCDGCGRPERLAGWEVRVDGSIVARLCSECGRSYRLGQPIRRPAATVQGAPAGQLEQQPLTA